jgi:hypothetical protein
MKKTQKTRKNSPKILKKNPKKNSLKNPQTEMSVFLKKKWLGRGTLKKM